MVTEFWGICLSVALAVILTSILSNSRLWAYCLLIGGSCAVIGGLLRVVLGVMVSGFDNPTGGKALVQQGFVVVIFGIVGGILGWIGIAFRSDVEEQ